MLLKMMMIMIMMMTAIWHNEKADHINKHFYRLFVWWHWCVCWSFNHFKSISNPLHIYWAASDGDVTLWQDRVRSDAKTGRLPTPYCWWIIIHSFFPVDTYQHLYTVAMHCFSFKVRICKKYIETHCEGNFGRNLKPLFTFLSPVLRNAKGFVSNTYFLGRGLASLAHTFYWTFQRNAAKGHLTFARNWNESKRKTPIWSWK